MKKISFGILIMLMFCLFQNCSFLKLGKLVENQKIEFKKNTVDLLIHDNRIMILDNVNYLLDIGAPNVIFQSKIHNFTIRDSVLIGSLKNVNGKSIENKVYVFDELQNNFFSVKNAVFRAVQNNNSCLEVNGLIGSELFQDKIVVLDFENKTLNIIRENNLTEYKEAEVVDFDGYYFIVKLKVNGLEVVAKLDTGNPYDLLLKKQDFNRVKDNDFNAYFIKNNEIDTLRNSISTIYFEGANDASNFVIKSNNYIKRNLLGVGFMKNYNWILDFEKGRVFYKRIDDNILFIQKNKVINSNGKLIYYETTNSANISRLSIELVTVDNIKINSNNICEIQSVLNNSENWDMFEITLTNNVNL